MKTWLNCVFWNLQDARHPQQRGDYVPKPGEKPGAKQARENREANNEMRAPHLTNAIANIARLEDVDLFLFAEYHLDHSTTGGDGAFCRRLEQATGRQFARLENRLRISGTGKNAPTESGKNKHIAIFSHMEPDVGRDASGPLPVVEAPKDLLNEEPFDEARLTLRALSLPGEPDPLLLASSILYLNFMRMKSLSVRKRDGLRVVSDMRKKSSSKENHIPLLLLAILT